MSFVKLNIIKFLKDFVGHFCTIWMHHIVRSVSYSLSTAAELASTLQRTR